MSYERSSHETPKGPQRSAEGWVLFVTSISPHSHEEDVEDIFLDEGCNPTKLILDRDRKTGMLLGYALVEFESKEDAEHAIKECNGKEHLGSEIQVNWAFTK
ncbi:hypothetical protein TrVE_jg3617 [Triparma verrucosa]|uniref:RRM domain-containing protein n=1 Tax=Triparma verrucosa TaxID=1606542 RepID=A0A9W7F346_9STRA|nr:hypothetical protein TrVE_jg3617 [Triparma verrucosa]